MDDMMSGMTFHVRNADGTTSTWTEPTLVEERSWRDVGSVVDISTLEGTKMQIQVQGMGAMPDYIYAAVSTSNKGEKTLSLSGCADYKWGFTTDGTVITMNVSEHSVRCCGLVLCGMEVPVPRDIKTFCVRQHWIDAVGKIPVDQPCALPRKSRAGTGIIAGTLW